MRKFWTSMGIFSLKLHNHDFVLCFDSTLTFIFNKVVDAGIHNV